MQARTEAIRKIEYARSFSMTSASKPRICRTDMTRPLLGGGVCGKNKQNTAMTTDAAEAIRNGAGDASIPSLPIERPMAIHPIVPNTRIRGKRRASGTFFNVMEVVSAKVGK